MPQLNPEVPPPFDQGVFLMHYNKGRQSFAEGRYAQARPELEIAQRLRPNDPDVLNLLGLVYFKTSAFPEAEVIYRRLVQDNPSVFILHSNLGLILFKQRKLDEAEEMLQRAISLRPNYSKSHLYLGLLYKERGRFGQALEHLQFAGADRAIREMEEMQEREAGTPALGKRPSLSTAPTSIATPTPLVPDEEAPAETKTVPGGVVPSAPRSSTSGGQILRPDPRPASTSHQAQDSAGEITAVQRTASSEAGATAARKLREALDEAPPTDETRLDLKKKVEGASRTFALHDNGFLEINFKDSVHVKRGTVSSYSGNLKFAAESLLLGTTAQTLVKATGHGKIFVYEKGRKAFLLDLNEEFIYVEGANLLALEDSLSYRVEPIYDASYRNKIDTVKIFGRGSLAISTSIEPLTLRVTREYPLSISSNALVAWTGKLTPSVIDDRHLENVMIATDDDSFKIRFEGDGVVVSEQ